MSKPEETLYEGEIYRFKPGYQKDFTPRWVQLTNINLKYYENQYAAQSCRINKRAAIESLPMEHIIKAKPVQFGSFEI